MNPSSIAGWPDYVLCCIPFQVRSGIFLLDILIFQNKKAMHCPNAQNGIKIH